MTKEDRETIESLLNNMDETSINRLKDVAGKYGADVTHTCFCKESSKIRLLDKIRDWYNQQPND